MKYPKFPRKKGKKTRENIFLFKKNKYFFEKFELQKKSQKNHTKKIGK